VSFQEVVHSAPTVNADVAKHTVIRGGRMDTHKNAPLTPKVERPSLQDHRKALSRMARPTNVP
jgi:hypothetical protein